MPPQVNSMETCDPWSRYSKTITYLKCADNNRASTVLSAFVSAVYIHGLPERIRSDLGGENVDVWRFMVEQHGSATAVITGSSTHNERIERLWRDVHRCVCSLFSDTLEHEGRLSEIDLYCLHYHVLIQHYNHLLNHGTTTPLRTAVLKMNSHVPTKFLRKVEELTLHWYSFVM